MSSFNAIVKTDESNVGTAAPGKVNFFVGLDNILRSKDEADVVRAYDGQIATSLGNVSANPTDLSASIEPTAGAVGWVWALTTFGPPHAADLVNPRAALVSQTVRQLVAPITASDTAEIDELVLVDLDGAAGDVTVTLPPATTGLVDREIWIKIVTDGFPVNGRRVVIAPDGAETVDGLAAGGGGHLELLTNYEWRKLRVQTGGGAWMVVG